MDDPDAYDPRDDEDEGGEEKAETTKSTSKRGGGRRPTGRAKTASHRYCQAQSRKR